MSIVPNKPTPTDPYQTLGLSHDATPSQIKSNYRKLALQYHPDRQSPSTDNQDEITSKFVEIAAAYAILSDPAKKREYDHLYKFGAFDTGESDSSPNQANNNYQYTENYSGGYYTTTTTPLHRSRSNVSTDSFFDDIMYSPESRKKKMCREGESRTKRGIGFAFAPLGKHLSVHVPSRNEIVMGMARGEYFVCKHIYAILDVYTFH
jgi:curved DNA-binding protein CbpA